MQAKKDALIFSTDIFYLTCNTQLNCLHISGKLDACKLQTQLGRIIHIAYIQSEQTQI